MLPKALVLSAFLSLTASPLFAGENIVCALKEAKNPRNYTSLKVDLDAHKDDDTVYTSKKAVDIGKMSFSFNLQLVRKKTSVSIDVIFDENKITQDEYSSASWEIDLSKAEPKKPIVQDELTQRNKKIADFVCYYNKTTTTNKPENTAKIKFTNEEDKKATVSYNEKGELVFTPNPLGWSPTIKAFREDGELTNVCYDGEKKAAKEMLADLVDAANGDGDSWAVLKRIQETKDQSLIVHATITDEGGERDEHFAFPRCK